MKNETQLELMVIICNRGYADRITSELNILTHFHSIIRAKGTAPNDILSALGIGEPEKDMVFCFCEKKNVEIIYGMLDSVFEMASKHIGIAMTVPVAAVGGNVTLQILLGKTRNLL